MADKPPILDQQPPKPPPIILDYETPRKPAKPTIPLVVRMAFAVFGSVFSFFALAVLVGSFTSGDFLDIARGLGCACICGIAAYSFWKRVGSWPGGSDER